MIFRLIAVQAIKAAKAAERQAMRGGADKQFAYKSKRQQRRAAEKEARK